MLQGLSITRWSATTTATADNAPPVNPGNPAVSASIDIQVATATPADLDPSGGHNGLTNIRLRFAGQLPSLSQRGAMRRKALAAAGTLEDNLDACVGQAVQGGRGL